MGNTVATTKKTDKTMEDMIQEGLHHAGEPCTVMAEVIRMDAYRVTSVPDVARRYGQQGNGQLRGLEALGDDMCQDCFCEILRQAVWQSPGVAHRPDDDGPQRPGGHHAQSHPPLFYALPPLYRGGGR